jgi:hypothetical protein
MAAAGMFNRALLAPAARGAFTKLDPRKALTLVIAAAEAIPAEGAFAQEVLIARSEARWRQGRDLHRRGLSADRQRSGAAAPCADQPG